MFNRIGVLIVKETLAVLRDPRNRLALMVLPLIQLLVFSFTVTLEVKNINLAVLDDDYGQISSELIHRFEASENFGNIRFVHSVAALRDLIDRQAVIAAVHFQADFSQRFYTGRSPSIGILMDGRKSNASEIVEGYITSIVDQYNTETAAPLQDRERKEVSIAVRNWFNPNLDYIWFTVPCLIAIITLQVSMIVTSMSVAREREMGTFDQLLVSPLGPMEIMAGKAIPAFLLALAEVPIFSLVAVFIFRIPFRGSLLLLYGSLIVYIAAAVGIGLAISAVVATQQQALLGTFMFIMPAVLTCGYMTPIENMPNWLQPLTYANPLRYIMVIVKGLFLKNLPAADVFANVWPLALIATIGLTVATWFFRGRLA
jgi:ABC-2 type transport system permease protein